MEDQLNRLKERLNSNLFKDFYFSEERHRAVKETIKMEKENLNCDGTTFLLLLNTIQGRSLTGFEISNILQEEGEAAFTEQEGGLYTLLHRLEYRDLICSEWSTDNNKNRKYYSLTTKGKQIVSLANKREKHVSISFRGVFEGGQA